MIMKKTLFTFAFAGVFAFFSCSKLDLEADKLAIPFEGDHAMSQADGLNIPDKAKANAVLNFRARLSGDQEVPPVETNARGQASFQLDKDGSSIKFRVVLANIENVTAAHIHAAPFGVNGPVVVWLYPLGPPAELLQGKTNGILAQGVISEDDLVGPLEGLELSDLLDLLQSGGAYVNVHTSQFPAGEVRGQIY
jgi:hypothetical protein